MFSKERYKHYFLLSVLIILSGIILFHGISYYNAHNEISHRAVAGLIILTVFFIQRIILTVKDVKLYRLFKDPFENSEFIEIIGKNSGLFKEEQKKKKLIVKNLSEKMEPIISNKKLFSEIETKSYFDKIISQSMNLILTLTIIIVLIVYKNLAYYYGFIGIGIAMFIGVSCAAYITSSIKIIKNLISTRKESKFIRLYKLCLLENKIESITTVTFFTNTYYFKNISLSILLSQDMKPISYLFVFFNTYFIDIDNDKIINGFYNGEENLIAYSPVNEKLIEYTCNFIDKNEFIFDENIIQINRTLKNFNK